MPSLNILPPYHHAHADGEHRYHVYYGGAGGGKSHYATQRLITRMLTEQGQRYLVIRKYYTTIKESVYHLLLQELGGLGLLPFCDVRQSPFRIKYPPTGSEILFIGLDDPEKVKSISAINTIWVEECTEIRKADFEQLDLRLRAQQDTAQEIILTFNPVDVGSWVYSTFFSPGPLRDLARVVKTTYLDNPYLPESYAQTMERLRLSDENRYRVYALGEWGSYQGTVYQPFDMVDAMPANPGETYFGLDFGYNNPSALVEVQEYDGHYYLREHLYSTGLTPEELLTRVVDIVGTKRHYVYCDAAEPARIEALARAGVLAKPANKSVKDGIGWVLSHHQQIHTLATNEHLNREVTAYRYKTTKDGVSLDEPEKDNDHALDAMRYALYTHAQRKGKIPRVFGVG